MNTIHRLIPAALLVLGALLIGCVQLVAFDQAIIGQPDYTGPPDQHPETLCDNDVEIGGSALCNASCVIEGEETTCQERVTLDGRNARVDVSGLREVELTLTVCAQEGRTFRLAGTGASDVRFEGRALEVGSEETLLLRQPENLPEDECVERTLVMQDGRMALLDAGRRVCARSLPAFDDAWEIEMASGVESLELCFREPR